METNKKRFIRLAVFLTPDGYKKFRKMLDAERRKYLSEADKIVIPDVERGIVIRE